MLRENPMKNFKKIPKSIFLLVNVLIVNPVTLKLKDLD